MCGCSTHTAVDVIMFVAFLQGLAGDGVGDEEETPKLAASTLQKPMSLLDRWQACSSTAQVS